MGDATPPRRASAAAASSVGAAGDSEDELAGDRDKIDELTAQLYKDLGLGDGAAADPAAVDPAAPAPNQLPPAKPRIPDTGAVATPVQSNAKPPPSIVSDEEKLLQELEGLFEEKIVERQQLDGQSLKHVAEWPAQLLHMLITSMSYFANYQAALHDHYCDKSLRHWPKLQSAAAFVRRWAAWGLAHPNEAGKAWKLLSKVDVCLDELGFQALEMDAFKPEVDAFKPEQAEKIFKALSGLRDEVERKQNDYFGSFLSDDESDTEEEQRAATAAAAPVSAGGDELSIDAVLSAYHKKCNPKMSWLTWIRDRGRFQDTHLKHSPRKMLEDEAQRVVDELLSRADRDVVLHELKLLNKALKDRREVRANDSGSIDVCLSSATDAAPEYRLGTRFFVPSFRGVAYFLDRFNQCSRRAHRRHQHATNQTPTLHLSEQVVLSITNRNFYLELPRVLENPASWWTDLQQSADNLRALLGELRSSGALALLSNKPRLFDNLLDLLQYMHSNGINRFYELMDQLANSADGAPPEAERRAELFRQHFAGRHGNMFVPSSDFPAHALRYGFGDKPPLNAFAVEPRYRRDGRPERPYAGVLATQMHPILDFLGPTAPNYLPRLVSSGRSTLQMHIAPENEIAFLAHAGPAPAPTAQGARASPAYRIIDACKLRYPSFRDPWRAHYQRKYFLSQKQYQAVQDELKSPTLDLHGADCRHLVLGVRWWLELGHSLRTLRLVRDYVRAQGADSVLVFPDPQGEGFALHPPMNAVADRSAAESRAAAAQAIIDGKQGEMLVDAAKGAIYKSSGLVIREVPKASIDSVHLQDLFNSPLRSRHPGGTPLSAPSSSSAILASTPSATRVTAAESGLESEPHLSARVWV